MLEKIKAEEKQEERGQNDFSVNSVINPHKENLEVREDGLSDKILLESINRCIENKDLKNLYLLCVNYGPFCVNCGPSLKLTSERKKDLVELIINREGENILTKESQQLDQIIDFFDLQTDIINDPRGREIIKNELVDLIGHSGFPKESIENYKNKINCSSDLWQEVLDRGVELLICREEISSIPDLLQRKGIELSKDELGRILQNVAFNLLIRGDLGRVRNIVDNPKIPGKKAILYCLKSGDIQTSLEIMENLEITEEDLKK